MKIFRFKSDISEVCILKYLLITKEISNASKQRARECSLDRIQMIFNSEVGQCHFNGPTSNHKSHPIPLPRTTIRYRDFERDTEEKGKKRCSFSLQKTKDLSIRIRTDRSEKTTRAIWNWKGPVVTSTSHSNCQEIKIVFIFSGTTMFTALFIIIQLRSVVSRHTTYYLPSTDEISTVGVSPLQNLKGKMGSYWTSQ